MPLGTITLQATGVGGSSTDPIDVRDGSGNLVRVVNVVLSAGADYPTGGFALTPQQLGFTNGVLFAQCEQAGAATGAVTGGLGNILYNVGTSKLQCFNNGGTEVAANTNLNAATAQIIAWGW